MKNHENIMKIIRTTVNNSKFPGVVRPVAPSAHLFAHARHVARDAGVAADGIIGVRGRDRHVLHQDVGSQAATEQGRTGRATNAVGIVAIQLDTWDGAMMSHGGDAVQQAVQQWLSRLSLMSYMYLSDFKCSIQLCTLLKHQCWK